MKLHFEPHQSFQLDAINAVAGIFEGQPPDRGDFEYLSGDALFQGMGIGNRLTLGDEQILENVRNVQKVNPRRPPKIPHLWPLENPPPTG